MRTTICPYTKSFSIKFELGVSRDKLIVDIGEKITSNASLVEEIGEALNVLRCMAKDSTSVSLCVECERMFAAVVIITALSRYYEYVILQDRSIESNFNYVVIYKNESNTDEPVLGRCV